MSRICNVHPCNGCIYLYNPSGNRDSSWRMCDYWELTGHRRPCKPGKDCTVKELGKTRRNKIRPQIAPQGRRLNE